MPRKTNAVFDKMPQKIDFLAEDATTTKIFNSHDFKVKKWLSNLPKARHIIVSFPSIGFVGSIVTEYILEHLSTRLVLSAWSNNNLALPVHNYELIYPVSLYELVDKNILVFHVIQNPYHFMPELLDLIKTVYFESKTEEIIAIDGILDSHFTLPKVFYYSTNIPHKIEKFNVSRLENGIIMGFGANILLESMNCLLLFSTTDVAINDAHSAIALLDVMNAYLDLKVNKQDLIVKAKKFEQKLKHIHMKKKLIQMQQEKKAMLNYVG